MRLTVGPLPAAVYWRRRAVVLVGLALPILLVAYACAGADLPTARPAALNGPVLSPPAAASRTTAVATRLPSATQPAPIATAAPALAPCRDDELLVTAAADGNRVLVGTSIDFTIRIKNVARRTCRRDIGADHQELRLMDLDQIIWSSDDCAANSGSDIYTLTPGREVSFTLTWRVRRSRTGSGAISCTTSSPSPQSYDLVARLDQKLSEPFKIVVTATP
jgi:hypothetical protein